MQKTTNAKNPDIAIRKCMASEDKTKKINSNWVNFIICQFQFFFYVTEEWKIIYVPLLLVNMQKKFPYFRCVCFPYWCFSNTSVLKTNDTDVALEENRLFKIAYVERNFDCPFRVFSFLLFHECVWCILYILTFDSE